MNTLKKKMNKKGFTLAELLIVVAIIAVLVAISIPIFTSQLEKSRDAVSIANIRAAYAEASSIYLTATENETVGKVTINYAGKTATVTGVSLKGTKDGFSGLENEFSFTHTLSDNSTEGGTPGDYSVLFTFDANGGCTLTSLTKATSGTN